MPPPRDTCGPPCCIAICDHLPPPPATVLDVGGGAGHQSLPLAEDGYDVTIVDSSAEMLGKARLRLAARDDATRRRVHLIEAPGEAADAATASRRDPYRQMSRVFHLVGRRTRR